jgi:hypothetical protein
MRGRRPSNLKSEGKQLAEHMGYHWADNTDSSIKFDGLMYRANRMVAVALRKYRYGLDVDCIIEKKIPEDVAVIRTLPLPPYIFREIWIRTQNERAFRRFCIFPDTTAEIEENTAENYRNSHFREEYWKKAPYRIEIPLQPDGREKG